MGYWVLKAVLTPLMRFAYRIRCRDLGQMPASGPVVLASNHQSFIDSLFIPLVLRRRVTFLAKAEYFDNPRTAWFFRAMGQIPITRGGGSETDRALAVAQEVLDAGGVLAIYPEGTRSPDGRLYKGHTGVARIALAGGGVPVIPFALTGTREIQPIDVMRPKLFRTVQVRVGEALSWPELVGRSAERAVLRQVTDEVVSAIGQLSGQERAPSYAPRSPRRAERPAPVARPAAASARSLVEAGALAPPE